MTQDSITIEVNAEDQNGQAQAFTLKATYPKEQGLPMVRSINGLNEDDEQLEAVFNGVDIESGLLEWTATYTSEGLSVDIEFSVQFEGGKAGAEEPTDELIGSVSLFAHSLRTGKLATRLLEGLLQGGDLSAVTAYAAATGDRDQ